MEQLLYIIQDAIEIGLMWSLLTLGIFISFRVLNFADLTAEGSITLGGAIAAAAIIGNIHPLIATLMAMIAGFIVGAITGILHTKLKIPAILAGIITMTGLYSINLKVMGQAFVSLGDKSTIYSYLRTLIDNQFFSKGLTSLIIVVLMFFVLYWFFGTEIGMSLRATGMNQKMASAQGINTNAMIILGLAISNSLICLSGALIAQSGKSANMDVGKGTIVIGLASIIIGEVIFGKRSFKNWLISVILGSIIYQALVGIAITLGLDPNDLKLLQAILIAIILSLPLIQKKYQKKGLVNAQVN
ncbi:MAG TPA: ABC transporter permease [Acholeplasmataceae bacterium]|nr:ABC transporter permease [Acholeplasmataceae bacterium]